MRVIGGSARGVPLKGPPSPHTRATSDKVRGAIFDVLAAELADARVLDLYAGTGALGIEALSRGAAACLFVERAGAACRVIEANLRATRLTDAATVWCMSVAAALRRLESALPSPPDPLSLTAGEGEHHEPSTFGPPYDVIMLDPPYDDPGIAGLVEWIARSGLLARSGLVVLEHSKRLPPPEPGDLHLRRTRRYGDTAVTIWQRHIAAEPSGSAE